MLKKLPGERWKPLQFPGSKQLRNRYAVSSAGRIASYRHEIFSDGRLLTGSVNTGYRTINIHRPDNNSTLYIHREIAKAFLTRPTAQRQFVIHLNHDKLDNRVKNLAWASAAEIMAHQQQSPARKAYKIRQANRVEGSKLHAADIRRIRKEFLKRQPPSVPTLAKEYGVTEMTIYRIRRGESWKHIR